MVSNLQKYKAFLTVVEYGSFTKSAEILQYSQSAISKMIQDLEAEWKVTLFERKKTGIVLSSDGLRLLPHIKEICKAHEKLEIEVDDLSGLQSGIIRIGTFSSVATHWLPNIIQEFQKDYPNIEYELLLGDYDEIEKWILEGRVDCGLTRLPTSKKMEAYPVGRDELKVVLSELHPLVSKERITVEEICEYPFLLLEKNGNKVVSEVFDKKKPKVRLTTWDDYSIMSMVERGLGISILPELILKRVPYKIQIRSLEHPIYREIGFVVKEFESTSLAVKRFKEYLKYK